MIVAPDVRILGLIIGVGLCITFLALILVGIAIVLARLVIGA